jgi:hypothetical protein
MEILELLVGYLTWPLTAVVLAFLLRRQILALLDRLKSARFPGGIGFELFPLPHEEGASRITAETHGGDVNRDKIEAIYWLGHDLMWTVDVLLRGGPGSYVTHGLRQSCKHIRTLGLQDSRQGQAVLQLLDKAEGRLESAWTTVDREALAKDILGLRSTIAEEAIRTSSGLPSGQQ